jgi:hypothetical protein
MGIEAGLGFRGFRDVGMENRGLCLVKKETVGQGFSPANSFSDATSGSYNSFFVGQGLNLAFFSPPDVTSGEIKRDFYFPLVSSLGNS